MQTLYESLLFVEKHVSYVRMLFKLLKKLPEKTQNKSYFVILKHLISHVSLWSQLFEKCSVAWCYVVAKVKNKILLFENEEAGYIVKNSFIPARFLCSQDVTFVLE